MISDINNKLSANYTYINNSNTYKESNDKLNFSDKLNNIKANLNSNDSKADNKSKTSSKLEQAKKEMHEEFDKRDGVSSFTSTIIMGNVIDLDISNNKEIYLKENGKIDFNKVANDVGISLSNCSFKELNSLKIELEREGFVNKETSQGFIRSLKIENMISSANSRDNGGFISNIKIDLKSFLLSHKDFYESFGDVESSNNMKRAIEFFY